MFNGSNQTSNVQPYTNMYAYLKHLTNTNAKSSSCSVYICKLVDASCFLQSNMNGIKNTKHVKADVSKLFYDKNQLSFCEQCIHQSHSSPLHRVMIPVQSAIARHFLFLDPTNLYPVSHVNLQSVSKLKSSVVQIMLPFLGFISAEHVFTETIQTTDECVMVRHITRM